MGDERLELRIMGTVQGVGYRAWTVRTASGLDLRGWVRNETDGSVKAVAVGQRRSLEQLELRCHDGPSLARVDEVTAAYGPLRDDEAFDGFRVV